MNTKTTAAIVILSAIASLVGFVMMYAMPHSPISSKLALGGSAISQLSSILYLWPSSTITQKKVWKFIVGAIVLTLVGSYLNQFSKTWGASLSFIGYVGVIGLYFIHFVQKKLRSKLDIVKLMWVVLTYLLIMLNALSSNIPTNLEYLTTPLLWYGAYLFYLQKENADSDRTRAGW